MSSSINRRKFLNKVGGGAILTASTGLITGSTYASETKKSPMGGNWTYIHGTSAVIEYPDRAIQRTENGLVRPGIWRNAWGTELSQGPNTENWVHFFIPTFGLEHLDAIVKMWVDFDILIDRAEIWMGNQQEGTTSKGEAPGTLNNMPLVGRQRETALSFDIFNNPSRAGLGISLHVVWKDFNIKQERTRTIKFISAGANFN